MKKLIAMMLALTLILGLAACGTTGTNDKENLPVPANALEILETIWNAYGETDKFPISGGNPEYHAQQFETNENYEPPMAPLNYDLQYAEGLTGTMLISAENLQKVDQAATMSNAMLANNFSCGAFHLTDGTDTAAFAKDVRDAVMNNQWICGMPETLVIASFGDGYLLIAYGVNDAMTPFQTYLSQAYPGAQILYKEAIAG